MKLVSFYHGDSEESGIIIDEFVIPIRVLNSTYNWNFPLHLDDIFKSNQFFDMKQQIHNLSLTLDIFSKSDLLLFEDIAIAPLYRHPSKILGIGLNYQDHAADLDEKTPSTIPASFMKADTTIIGYKDEIHLPSIAEKTTGEAELGVIFGKKCKNVPQNQWKDVIAGFTCIIDMTAESILRKNPRYLTISKNFDTFFSFGPVLITPEEVPDVLDLKVATVLNGKIHAENSVNRMTFSPNFLVAFHSKIMTFLPGDIISTGTPRAVELHNKDIIECRITGFPSLHNPVV